MAVKFYQKSDKIIEAIKLLLDKEQVKTAIALAKESFSQGDFKENLLNFAQDLHQQGNLLLAERIYLECKCPDQAIKMYKKAQDFSNMIRIFEQHRPDVIETGYLIIAR